MLVTCKQPSVDMRSYDNDGRLLASRSVTLRCANWYWRLIRGNVPRNVSNKSTLVFRPHYPHSLFTIKSKRYWDGLFTTKNCSIVLSLYFVFERKKSKLKVWRNNRNTARAVCFIIKYNMQDTLKKTWIIFILRCKFWWKALISLFFVPLPNCIFDPCKIFIFFLRTAYLASNATLFHEDPSEYTKSTIFWICTFFSKMTKI